MMTTLAALFGALPLALESGTGSELRFPLGVTIIGGLLLSQLLTLYTTPVIYLALERLRRARGAAHGTGRRRCRRSESRAMNFSDPFIRRPIGTTLLAIGLFLVGARRLSFPAGREPAERRPADHPGLGEPARRRSGDHGGDGRGAARAAARRDRRRDRDHLAVLARLDLASRCSSTSRATSTAPRATCRRRINAAAHRPAERPAARCRPSARSTRRRRRC